MMTLRMPQLLLIAGTGRDSGKTALACSIIEKFSSTHPLTALKISRPHHSRDQAGKIWVNEEGFFVMEELQTHSGKDSSRMLAAGAHRSFFIMASDDQLARVIPLITGLTGQETLLICESGSLRKYIEPGQFFIINPAGNEELKAGTKELMKMQHTWINYHEGDTDFINNRLEVSNHQWVMK